MKFEQLTHPTKTCKTLEELLEINVHAPMFGYHQNHLWGQQSLPFWWWQNTGHEKFFTLTCIKVFESKYSHVGAN